MAGGRNKSFTVVCSARKEEVAVSLAQMSGADDVHVLFRPPAMMLHVPSLAYIRKNVRCAESQMNSYQTVTNDSVGL